MSEKREAMKGKRRALFLDRDGTINVDKGYTHQPEDLEFIPGMPELIRRFNEEGWLVIVATNQAGVARGYYTEADVERFHEEMNRRLKEQYGAQIDAFYYCPHHPTYGVGAYRVDCECRKPKPGMLRKAIEEWNIDAEQSMLIGDQESDIEAGRAVNLDSRYLQAMLKT